MEHLRSVKILVLSDGNATLAPATQPRGYGRENPVVEIVGVPPGTSGDDVLRAYKRCMILPMMHAEMPVPWHRIKDAREGAIVRLRAGRPEKDDSEHSQRINITLSPAAIRILDERGGGRSKEIERLIMDSRGTSQDATPASAADDDIRDAADDA